MLYRRDCDAGRDARYSYGLKCVLSADGVGFTDALERQNNRASSEIFIAVDGLFVGDTSRPKNIYS